MRPHSPLIQTDELASRLGSVTVLDIRWSLAGPPGHEEYLRGHIPGASYVDLETDLADPPGDRGRHPLPDPVRFTDAMRRAGVSSERPVVVYDDVFGTSATRGLVAAEVLRAPARPGPRRRLLVVEEGRLHHRAW